MKKASALPSRDQVLEDFLDVLDRAAVVGIEHRDGACAPSPSNRSFDITTPGLRALRIAVTPTPCSAASCDSGASVARPTPRPSTTMFFQPGSSVKPCPSGPAMLKSSPGFERRHAARAAAFGLVEKLDLARRLVDAVDAHRPAHPDLGAVGRRAEQVEHLPRIGLQRVLMHLEDDVLVFVVDPVVGDDRADELAHQPLRIGVDVADPQRGIGVVAVRVERHRSGVSSGGRAILPRQRYAGPSWPRLARDQPSSYR